MISITINFDCLETTQQFLKDYQQIQNKRIKPKKENDRRGQKTKAFHNVIKQYKEQNPDKTYLECLKSFKENNKNIE
jgi:hypothetical protein